MYTPYGGYSGGNSSNTRPGLQNNRWATAFEFGSMGSPASGNVNRTRSKGYVDYYADPHQTNNDTIKPSEYHTVDIGTDAFTKFVGGQSVAMHGGAFGGKRHGPLSQYSQSPGAIPFHPHAR